MEEKGRPVPTEESPLMQVGGRVEIGKLPFGKSSVTTTEGRGLSTGRALAGRRKAAIYMVSAHLPLQLLLQNENY